MSRLTSIKTLTMGLATVFLTAGIAQAGSPNGMWKRSNGAIIKVSKCGGGIGMKVVKSPSPKKVGKTIMCGAKKTGPNKWQGSLLNLDDGQTYSGYVKLNGNSLTLSGCLVAGIICKNDTWKRQ